MKFKEYLHEIYFSTSTISNKFLEIYNDVKVGDKVPKKDNEVYDKSVVLLNDDKQIIFSYTLDNGNTYIHTVDKKAKESSFVTLSSNDIKLLKQNKVI